MTGAAGMVWSIQQTILIGKFGITITERFRLNSAISAKEMGVETKDKLKMIAGDDALFNPCTDKQRLCKAINYLMTQYWMDCKGDEDLEIRYDTVIAEVGEIIADQESS